MTTLLPRQLVGIYMDHHEARIIDARSNAQETIKSKYESRLREKGQSVIGNQLGNYRSSNNEATEHHQEIHDTKTFYKSIAKSILAYDEIFIFGPTKAKQEFQNYLLRDQQFREKIIRIGRTDYATVPQQNAQVKKHFKAQL